MSQARKLADLLDSSGDVKSAHLDNATYSDVTTSARGLMRHQDKSKLDGIASGATNVTNNNQLTNGAGYVTSSGNTVIGTDSDVNTSGATIIDNLYMTDGVITSHGTRTLSASDIGALGDSAKSLSGNGYQKLSNGLTFQWGSTSVGANARKTVYFPTTFTTIYIAVADNMENHTDSQPGQVYSKSTSWCKIVNGAGSTQTCQWYAIGIK